MTKSAVPFVPVIKAGKDESAPAAKQLSTMIRQWEKEGWIFSHLEQITTVRNNGCLASMVGNPTSVITFQLAILEK